MATIRSITAQLKDGREVTIRGATEDDSENLLSCMKVIFDDGEGVVLLPEEFKRTAEKQREVIREHLTGEQSLLLLAIVDSTIVGMLDFATPKGKRFSHTGTFGMTLLPAFRSLGLGSILMDALIRWAESMPRLEKINLLVLASNERAISLYRKFGFVEEGRKRREVMLREGVYDDNVLMARMLRT